MAVGNKLWRKKDDSKKDSRRVKVGDRREREKLKAANKAVGGRGEAVVALNYVAGASFIRIPSPRCSLSGGIKEDGTIRLFIKALPAAHTKDSFNSCRGGLRW